MSKIRQSIYLVTVAAVFAALFASIGVKADYPNESTPGPVESGSRATRALTFADRVAYQRAIEDVYWRHRIWPKENPGPKPPLEEVMPQAEFGKKVEGYLRNSQALEDHWQKQITPDQLQGEMERMASDTKQPEVLRELFEALGNDPFVIAECLARPVLTERLTVDLSIDRRAAARLESPPIAEPPTAPLAQAAYTLPAIADPSGGCVNDTWTPTTLTGAPSARHTAR